ncbi:hypothetical protein LA20531_01680 [Lactobacillus amylovorus DSM 20531]|uniref:hypothetical protein n=1 Tax=Lactobacillus amylovorus TaxID=1604 RepID=UPI0006EE9B46|nr:hypothetical protein [Lactobacillus amylovorus]ATO52482.1 hypothetical protein LA20531_01680 [Lactobacillus amylovorus DSM 20531]KRK43107.1 hypothetical protein FC63_GL000422 [Lactobacillus amylovorus DSM 20531]MCT3591957.1 hypothetical protein [Lactobacillus amylovorus]
MFSVQTDITEQMQGFSKFAKQDDVNHAMDEIILICRKTMMPPRTVLYQIAKAANESNQIADYQMACKIQELLDEQRNEIKRKSEMIEDSVNDAIFGLKELAKSGNPAMIKNYIEAVRLDLEQIESVL